jgi:hypothetical protein
MREREAERARFLARERDDLRELFRRELGRRSRAVVVAQNIDDERIEIIVGNFLRFGAEQDSAHSRKAVTPSPNPLPIHAEPSRLFSIPNALRGPQDDASALDQKMR